MKGPIRENLTLQLFLITGLIVSLGSMLEYWWSGWGLYFPTFVLGWALGLFSFVLRRRAIAALGRFWSLHVEIRDNHEFVQTGPFHYVRHPVYFSMILELLAFAALCHAWVMALIAPLLFVPVLLLRVRMEEEALIEKFGEGYREYRRTTPCHLSAPMVEPFSRSQGRRVVITGMGVVAANGRDLTTFWKSIRDGRSGGGLMTRFNAGPTSPTTIAAQVEDFDASMYMDAKTARRLDYSHRYGVSAAVMAHRDAGNHFEQIDPDRVGVVEGTTASNNESVTRADEGYQRRGYKGVSPNALMNGYSGAGAGEIAQELNILGHAISLSSSSASGNDAVGYALNMIRHEEVDVMVAGGSEAPILPNIWGALCVGRVLSRRNETPKQAMRPFDKSRDGILLGEGAAYLVLEELSHALSRGARIYAEIIGHGRSCEAYHPVAPHPDGIGPYRALQKALRNAQVDPQEVDYINAHGTATEANDLVETKAIKRLFGPHAYRMGISSTKPITGHLMGAAGALETVVTALAIYHQEMPLTLNHQEGSADCDLDYIPGRSRPYPIGVALNLSSGFGGKNSCLVLRRFTP